MPQRRNGPSNGRRKTGIVRGRRALNAFRIDKEDVSEGTREAEETLERSSDAEVKSEDDEDIDSDEAFDESDEERYSTFKFSGSSSKGGMVSFLVVTYSNNSGKSSTFRKQEQ